MSPQIKPKTKKASLDNLLQNLSQLETNLKTALINDENDKVKDYQKSIKFTKLVIDRIKSKNDK